MTSHDHPHEDADARVVPSSSEPSTPHALPAAAQPQWPRPSLVSIRDFNYTHTQPQWQTALRSLQRAASREPAPRLAAHRLVARKEPLPARRTCTTCHFAKEACTCSRCAVCRDPVYRRHRHHCRRCWRAVCPLCYGKERHVNPLGTKQLVCDQCAVPWALANLAKRENRGLFWGLYLLRRAGEMPCLCVAPPCRTLTYRTTCYVCGTPTVMTQPHVERLLRVDANLVAALDRVRMLNGTERSLRALAVNRLTTEDVEVVFRACFPRYEELTAFEGIRSTREGQQLLLSLVAASVSYEYHSAPDLTLAFSDVPYAKLLKVIVARPRYSILESPGQVKYIAFPGTHNWRTRFVDMRLSQEVKRSWAPLVEGVCIDPGTGQPVLLCGGLRQVWSYRVHGGFAQEMREADVPIEQLANDVRQGYRLALSGHSLGGAVAQLVAVQLLSRYPDLFPPCALLAPGQPPPILCVTMGAPLVGNYEFADRITRSGWAPYFHHLIYRTDVVPRLSCGDELTWDAASRVMEQASTLYRNVQNWFTWRQEAAAALEHASAPSTPAPETAEHGGDHPSHADPDASSADGTGMTAVAANVAATVSARLAHRRQQLANLTAGDDVTDTGTAADVVRGRAPQLASQAAGTSLEDYVDASIRTGRDVLAEGEDAPMTAQEARAHVASALREARHTAPLPLPSRAPSSAPHTPRSASLESAPQPGVDAAVGGAAPSAQAEEDATAIALALSQEAQRRMHRRYACVGRFHLLCYGTAGYLSTIDSEVAFALLKNGCGEATRLIDHSVSSYNRGVMLQLYGKKE